jgi:hypothetical protein
MQRRAASSIKLAEKARGTLLGPCGGLLVTRYVRLVSFLNLEILPGLRSPADRGPFFCVKPKRTILHRRHIARGYNNPPMFAAWYLQKADQCARLADEATDPCDRDRFVSERSEWLRALADEIGADVKLLEITIALLPN